MRFPGSAALLTAMLLCGAAVVEAQERTMFVTGDRLNVRLCASSDCCVATRLNLYDEVAVFEERDGWARISVYYDAGDEARCPKQGDELAARWVAARYLSVEPPEGFDPNHWGGALGDRRIRGIPKVGDYGMTRADIRLLRRYAAHLLEDGTCTEIEAGNKSVSRPDTYYVYCRGEAENRYFEPSDVPRF